MNRFLTLAMSLSLLATGVPVSAQNARYYSRSLVQPVTQPPVAEKPRSGSCDAVFAPMKWFNSSKNTFGQAGVLTDDAAIAQCQVWAKSSGPGICGRNLANNDLFYGVGAVYENVSSSRNRTVSCY